MKHLARGAGSGSILVEACVCLALLSYGYLSLSGLVSQLVRGSVQVDRSLAELALLREELDELEAHCIRTHFAPPPAEALASTREDGWERLRVTSRAHVEEVPSCPGLYRLTVRVVTAPVASGSRARELVAVRLVPDPERIVPAPPAAEMPVDGEGEEVE